MDHHTHSQNGSLYHALPLAAIARNSMLSKVQRPGPLSLIHQKFPVKNLPKTVKEPGPISKIIAITLSGYLIIYILP